MNKQLALANERVARVRAGEERAPVGRVRYLRRVDVRELRHVEVGFSIREAIEAVLEQLARRASQSALRIGFAMHLQLTPCEGVREPCLLRGFEVPTL